VGIDEREVVLESTKGIEGLRCTCDSIYQNDIERLRKQIDDEVVTTYDKFFAAVEASAEQGAAAGRWTTAAVGAIELYHCGDVGAEAGQQSGGGGAGNGVAEL
jgi:hypothetical protein